MEITIEVPKKFCIEIEQIREYLTGNNWKQSPHSDNTDKFQSPTYKNCFAIIPKHENLVDIEYAIFSVLRFLANIEAVDIETIITKIRHLELCGCGHSAEFHIDGLECRGNNLNCMCDQYNAQDTSTPN